MVSVLLLLALPGLLSNASEPEDKRPVKIHVQYAGNLGLLSAGLGKPVLKNKMNMFILYGYLPKALNGVEVHTLAVRSSFTYANTRLSSDHSLDYYFGMSVLYGMTNNTYLRYPDYFPKGYYSITNAIHGCPHLGLQANTKFLKDWPGDLHFFAELGTIDYQVWSALTTRYVNIFEIWNVSFGMVITLD